MQLGQGCHEISLTKFKDNSRFLSRFTKTSTKLSDLFTLIPWLLYKNLALLQYHIYSGNVYCSQDTGIFVFLPPAWIIGSNIATTDIANLQPTCTCKSIFTCPVIAKIISGVPDNWAPVRHFFQADDWQIPVVILVFLVGGFMYFNPAGLSSQPDLGRSLPTYFAITSILNNILSLSLRITGKYDWFFKEFDKQCRSWEILLFLCE